jgi:hypothetical protein
MLITLAQVMVGLGALMCAVVLATVIPLRYRPGRSAVGAPIAPPVARRAAPPRLVPQGRGARPSVSVVVPTLNEAGCLPWVLERLPSWVTEVVLVDGLSTDETEVVARRARQDVVVVHQLRPGKGAALRAGFAAASGEVIVMIDADGSTNPDEMGRFVDALLDGAEFVKGSRHMRDGGSEDFTLIRGAGNMGLVRLVNLIYGSEFTDLCYGYCAFWRWTLDALALTADGFEIETELNLNAIKAGLKIREVPSFELHRRAGTSNLNAYRDGRRVLRTIMDERPGLDSRRKAVAKAIALVPVELAKPGSEHWVPAGADRRRTDRRSGDDSAYTGPERRSGRDRRSLPEHTVTVYRVIDDHLSDPLGSCSGSASAAPDSDEMMSGSGSSAA